MAVAKRYCIDDLVINNTVNIPLWQDADRTLLYNYLTDNNIVQPITKKLINLRKIGRADEDICLYEDLNYLYALIELFLILKGEIIECITEDEFEEIIEEYNLDCISETVRCKFGSKKMINDFKDLLELDGDFEGIDYMQIDNDDCNVFTVYE